MIIRGPHPVANFTIVSNETLDDERLSWKARGLLAYLLTKPETWEVQTKHLVKQAPDGQSSVETGLKELRDTGYLVRQRHRLPDGKFEWETRIYAKPQLAPHPDFPVLEKPVTGKSPHIERTKEVSTERERTDSLVIASETEATGSTELFPSEQTDPPPAKRERPRNELWDAMVEVCGIDPARVTKGLAGQIAKAVKDLKEVGATPDEIHQGAVAYRMAMPQATLTPTALAKHWGALGGYLRAPELDKNKVAVSKLRAKMGNQ